MEKNKFGIIILIFFGLLECQKLLQQRYEIPQKYIKGKIGLKN